MRSHHGVNVRVLPRSIGNGPDRWGTRQSISNRFARCLVKRRMRFGKANRTGLRAVTHMSCVDTFNRRDEGYDHDNAEYDGKDNHDGSAGVSVCRLLRIVFHGLSKEQRYMAKLVPLARSPVPKAGGQISWSASGENTDGFLHTHIANSESSRKFEIYRPNTWPRRPNPRREDFSCQLGAVHTWHEAEMPSRPTHVR